MKITESEINTVQALQILIDNEENDLTKIILNQAIELIKPKKHTIEEIREKFEEYIKSLKLGKITFHRVENGNYLIGWVQSQWHGYKQAYIDLGLLGE